VAKKTVAKKTEAKKAPKKSKEATSTVKNVATSTAKGGAATKAGAKSADEAKTSNPRARRAAGPTGGAEGVSRQIPAEATYLLDPAWLDAQREALLAERAKYTTSADRLAAEAAALMADREPGDVQFDEESGEGDTIAVERDRDLALSAAARQAVADIDAALARLDNQTYGLCLAGDDVIPKERLEAIPEASVCVQHKTSMF
jgi:RNA polymerase-binding transcription factor DksA